MGFGFYNFINYCRSFSFFIICCEIPGSALVIRNICSFIQEIEQQPKTKQRGDSQQKVHQQMLLKQQSQQDQQLLLMQRQQQQQQLPQLTLQQQLRQQQLQEQQEQQQLKLQKVCTRSISVTHNWLLDTGSDHFLNAFQPSVLLMSARDFPLVVLMRVARWLSFLVEHI